MASETPTVALVGAWGTLGSHVFRALVQATDVGKLVLLSRSAKSVPPVDDAIAPTTVAQVNYTSMDSLRGALAGCDVLVSCMGTEGDYMTTKRNLVKAAARTGTVRSYIPSEFGVDHRSGKRGVWDHPVWTDKYDHQVFAESLGLKVVAIYIGIFQEAPFALWDAWHGFQRTPSPSDPTTLTWQVAGTGHNAIAVTSKHDIGNVVTALVRLLSTRPAAEIPRQLRISGTSKTPCEIADIFNRAARGDGLTLKVVPITDEAEQRKVASELVCNPTNAAEVAALGPGFDAAFASEIAGRVFLGIGNGDVDFSKENDNELVNPGQTAWKWNTIEEYAEEVKGRP